MYLRIHFTHQSWESPLVSDLPELGQLTAKQISRLVGVAPINPDSGQHKGKRMIQGGRAQIRATLYMGAVVAMRHNPVIKTFYKRLVGRGKSKKTGSDCLCAENLSYS
ncbi:hypothetical protein MiYa_04584 [Microcystis aeruginosa NIES-2519]|uniref:Transposase IS116/IS110/IS902 C-terminal domain-containing protein n=1 Tax=Microcystis aeruginosa NIES-2519 TaxID=2303981 RepID=A0A5A5RDI6_MICAE|nr:hypothetical protein MiYa_04584 [Microcystis aeruginosa NIES-2519]